MYSLGTWSSREAWAEADMKAVVGTRIGGLGTVPGIAQGIAQAVVAQELSQGAQVQGAGMVKDTEEDLANIEENQPGIGHHTNRDRQVQGTIPTVPITALSQPDHRIGLRSSVTVADGTDI